MQALMRLGRCTLQRATVEGWPALTQLASANLSESRWSNVASTSAPAWDSYALATRNKQHSSPFSTSTRQYAGPADDIKTGSRLDYSVMSLGFVKDAYQVKPPLSLTFFMSKAGWKDAMVRFNEQLVRRAVLMKATQCIPGFSTQTLKLQVKELYEKVNSTLALNDIEGLYNFQDVLSEAELQRMVDEAERRLQLRQTVEWSLEGGPLDLRSISFVQGRMDKLHPSMQSTFLQLTVRIASQQRFALFNRRGELLAGDPDQVISVVDYWVLERKIMEPVQGVQVQVPGALNDARWRVVGRLQMQPLVQQGHEQQQQQTEAPKVEITGQQETQRDHRATAPGPHERHERKKQQRKQDGKRAVAWSSAFKTEA